MNGNYIRMPDKLQVAAEKLLVEGQQSRMFCGAAELIHQFGNLISV